MHVLLVEDDVLVGAGIEAGLRLHGLAVDRLSTVTEADAALQAFHTDVVILDLGLPDGNGMTLLARLRQRGDSVPVLVLTARDAVQDRVAGLRAGADDYLLKPFDLDELVARLQALLRRAGGHSQPMLVHGPLRLDPVSRQVWLHDAPVSLSRRELALLEVLLHSRRAVLSAEQLKDSLYGFEAEVESNAVNVHIHHLRRKLGSGIVKTVRGLGYQLGEPAPLPTDQVPT
ncbi:response regulator [Immundisolibacter sp.]|uniref:response regulator n=1 Tax=Immundisolibacter sp. TaxID=1934948 RepID=UPI002B0F47C8|nr:response regulator [Immundisolibacter sp.]MEA3219365.1 Transcriptional regulatory protein QseB [Immundisolibacter sp.]